MSDQEINLEEPKQLVINEQIPINAQDEKKSVDTPIKKMIVNLHCNRSAEMRLLIEVINIICGISCFAILLWIVSTKY
jgi:hypothetical protein